MNQVRKGRKVEERKEKRKLLNPKILLVFDFFKQRPGGFQIYLKSSRPSLQSGLELMNIHMMDGVTTNRTTEAG